MTRVFCLLVAALLAAGVVRAEPLPPDSIELVLAASWQPCFCLTESGRDKPECRSLTADRFDATHFSLHGLWPDDLDDDAIFPCYCGNGVPVSCRERRPRDRAIDLSGDVLDALAVAMPGVQSGLHLHQWTKHGACYEDDRSGPDNGSVPDAYFGDAMALLAALNASPVRALFADNRGAVLRREDIEEAFEAAFGAGAGGRVFIRCSGSGDDRIITELRINLAGDVNAPVDLARLILAAPPTTISTRTSSCEGGRVVTVE